MSQPHRSPRTARSLSPPANKNRPASLGVRRSFSPPSKQRVSNSQTLDGILSHPTTRAMFTQYCQSFHAPENIAFFLAVERYRNVKNDEARKEHAQQIYERFIRANAPNELGMMRVQEREQYEESCQSPDPFTFSSLQMTVLQEMSRHLLEGFIETPEYQLYINGNSKAVEDIVTPIIHHPIEKIYLENYLLRHGHVGWIQFLQAVEEFRAVSPINPEMRVAMATSIFNDYFGSVHSPIYLSIVPASARGDIAKGLESPFVSKDLFTPVSNLIMQQIRPLIPYFQKYAGASIYRSTLGDRSISPGVGINTGCTASLFEENRFSGRKMKNRIGARLPDIHRSNDGTADDWLLIQAGSLLRSGVAILCLEEIIVQQNGRTALTSWGLWDEKHISQFSRINQLASEEDVLTCVQLTHAGRKASFLPLRKAHQEYTGPLTDDPCQRVVSASPHPLSPLGQIPHELSVEEIHETIAAFAKSAEFACRAGFHMVEIQAGEGHLIHQFLSTVTNTRTDEWGGSLPNRFRFCLETARQVKRRIDPTTLLVFNLSITNRTEGSLTQRDSMELIEELKKIGVDAIICSSGEVTNMNMQDTDLGALLMFSRTVRSMIQIPTIICCNQDNASYLNSFICKMMADYIYFTEVLARNPQLVYQVARELNQTVYNPTEHNVSWAEIY